MKILIEELRDILAEELQIYEEMLELTVKKTKIIARGKINDLDNITQLENSLILRIGKIEDTREKVVKNIQNHFEIQEELSVTDILNYLDGKEDELRSEIGKMIERLSQVLDELKEKNNLNSLLIKDTLEYIELNLNLLTDATEQGTYNNKIQKDHTSQKISLFDTKA